MEAAQHQRRTQWRLARQELYAQLARSAAGGLRREAVLASRALFALVPSGNAPERNQLTPKPFDLPHTQDAVTVVCAEIPPFVADQWQPRTRAILSALRGQQNPLLEGGADKENALELYVSDPGLMHVTLFYTSHPDDLAPRNQFESKARRCEQEIAQLRDLAARFTAFRLKAVKVVLAASGAILLLFQCLESHGTRNTKAVNGGENAEFSVDLLRDEAQQTFPFVSNKGPSAIIHTTLARVLSPAALDEATLARTRETCARISEQLTTDDAPFVVDKLWYVDESHYIRPSGHTTVISLGSDCSK